MYEVDASAKKMYYFSHIFVSITMANVLKGKYNILTIKLPVYKQIK